MSSIFIGKKPYRKGILLVLLLVFFLLSFGSGYVLGKNLVPSNENIDPNTLFETGVIPNNAVLKRIQIPNFPSEYMPAEYEMIGITEAGNGQYAIGDLMLEKHTLSVLSSDNENAWNLPPNTKITLSFELSSEDGAEAKEQGVAIGYIRDCVMYPWENLKESKSQYVFTTKEGGFYWIYLLANQQEIEVKNLTMTIQLDEQEK